MNASAATGPLAGLRVVELGHVMAGPTCGMMLADLGAEVIKVERLPRGDDTRRFVPPEIHGESAAFMMMNRNKRGLAVNLRSESGRAALRRLIGTADVFVENYRPGALDEMGLGYEAMHKEHPALIYCSVTGFGRTGPFSGRGGLDLIAQGMSGLMSITGEGPGRPPVKVGAPMTDITAGILAAMGVLAAHIHRLATGEGQLVDTSLFEAGITHTYWQSAIALAGGVSPGAMGSAHPLSAPYQAFETADGWITVGAANQRNWERLTCVLEAEELLEDPRFVDNAARMAHRLELEAALSDHFRLRTTEAWLEAFEAAGLPGGPVLSIEEMHEHPQTRGREMLVATDHPVAGRVEALGPPVKLSATPANLRRPAPLLGEHTREVLAEAGYDEAEIEALIAAGDVAAAS
ncbi:MAG: CoA transferase [Proteobacteria bacterium]|nr:CoA transferase [Pseudomonadota bacterium]